MAGVTVVPVPLAISLVLLVAAIELSAVRTYRHRPVEIVQLNRCWVLHTKTIPTAVHDWGPVRYIEHCESRSVEIANCSLSYLLPYFRIAQSISWFRCYSCFSYFSCFS